MIGDCIKVSKEGKKMPGSKKLHQDSENSGKATYIFGHNFGVLGLLIGKLNHMFCIPISAEIHEGVEELRKFQGKDAPLVKEEKRYKHYYAYAAQCHWRRKSDIY